MTTDATIRKVSGLLERAKEEHGKLAALLEEIDALLGGKASIGEKLRQCHEAWLVAWDSRYHEEYAVTNWAEYQRQWKTLLRTFTPAQLEVRMMGYIKDDDPYYVQRKHPLNLFVRNVNQYVPVNGHAVDEAPVGCRHTPRCPSEVACTRKRAAELRA